MWQQHRVLLETFEQQQLAARRAVLAAAGKDWVQRDSAEDDEATTLFHHSPQGKDSIDKKHHLDPQSNLDSIWYFW